MRTSPALLMFAAALAPALTGCAASVKRVLPETVRTIAIARFQNATDQEFLRTLFDEQLRLSFRLDGRLNVAEDAGTADAVLKGTIVSYSRQPSRFSATNVVEEYRVSATVELMLVGNAGAGNLWVERGASPSAPPGPAVRRLATDTHFVVVPAHGLPVETEEDAQRRMVRDLAEEAVIKVLEGW